MVKTKQVHSPRTLGRVRRAREAGMGLGIALERRVLASENQDGPGSKEDTNPLMERALQVLQAADRVRFGWV